MQLNLFFTFLHLNNIHYSSQLLHEFLFFSFFFWDLANNYKSPGNQGQKKHRESNKGTKHRTKNSLSLWTKTKRFLHENVVANPCSHSQEKSMQTQEIVDLIHFSTRLLLTYCPFFLRPSILFRRFKNYIQRSNLQSKKARARYER